MLILDWLRYVRVEKCPAGARNMKKITRENK